MSIFMNVVKELRDRVGARGLVVWTIDLAKWLPMRAKQAQPQDTWRCTYVVNGHELAAGVGPEGIDALVQLAGRMRASGGTAGIESASAASPGARAIEVSTVEVGCLPCTMAERPPSFHGEIDRAWMAGFGFGLIASKIGLCARHRGMFEKMAATRATP